jgi:predicted nucleic acid-binding protein
MKRVFLDSDVILDFLTMRSPFAADAMKIIQYGYSGDLKISTSSLSISNIYYVISRIQGKRKALKKIKELLNFIEVLSVHQSTIENAAYSEFKDFEDALQNFTAQESDIRNLITRNIKDFVASSLFVQTPTEFIKEFGVSG